MNTIKKPKMAYFVQVMRNDKCNLSQNIIQGKYLDRGSSILGPTKNIVASKHLQEWRDLTIHSLFLVRKEDEKLNMPVGICDEFQVGELQWLDRRQLNARSKNDSGNKKRASRYLMDHLLIGHLRPLTVSSSSRLIWKPEVR